MNAAEQRALVDAVRRRPLTLEERRRLKQHLAAHPEEQSEWAAEALLSQALHRLPPAPVASNFTARVLAAVAADERRAASRVHGWSGWWRRLWPRVASAGVLTVGLVSAGFWWQIRQDREERFAQDLSRVVAAIPAPEILADFDAIYQMRQLPAVSDADLLTALQ